MPKLRTLFFIAAAAGFIYLLRRKMMTTPRFKEDGTRYWTVEEVRAAFQKVAQDYGAAYARRLEQLYRIEVGNWERVSEANSKQPSGQWKKCLSPGMVAAKKDFPYGWSSLKEFTDTFPKYRDGFYTVDFPNTKDGFKTYVGFPTVEASIMFVAWFIRNKRRNRFGFWNSLNEAEASRYEAKMDTINPRFN